MNKVRLICTRDANGDPHPDTHLADAQWDDDAATDMRIAKLDAPLFSTGTEIKGTEFLSTGWDVQCSRCHRGTFVDVNSLRERIVDALAAGELDVSDDLQ